MVNIQGWLNIYKPKGISSFFVVKKIKKYFKLNKIGHGGTLDPLAEGVLPLAIGKTTKLIPFINSNLKEYEFEIKWGEQTTTDDAEGEIINHTSLIPNENEIKRSLKNFNGEIFQKPPKASAIKVNGQRAYKLLREEKSFELKEKKVYLYSSEILSALDQKNITKIKIKCGKGFYVRSLARDMAENLNTKGHIYSLKRTKVGKFCAKNSNLLDDLLKIVQTLHEFKGFHSTVSMLDDILAYEIDDEKDFVSISQGRLIKINLKKFKNPLLNSVDGKIIFLTNKGRVLSFGKLNGNLFKPDKVLI